VKNLLFTRQEDNSANPIRQIDPDMNPLTAFGLFAVTAMVVTYALEARSPWFVLAFAASCILGSIYGFLQGAWPFGLVEAVWAVIAGRKWLLSRRKLHGR
jgi:hypothetical protein